MNHSLKLDDWRLIEEGWAPARSLAAERLFALGGAGQAVRGHFEEHFSGPTNRSTLLESADGAPFFGAEWLGIEVEIDGKRLDLADSLVSDFRRTLDFQAGWMERTCTVTTRAGKILKIYAKRFLFFGEPEIGAIRFAVVPMNFSGRLAFEPSIQLGEPFWQPFFQEIELENATISARSLQNEAQLAAAMRFTIYQDGEEIDFETRPVGSAGRVACRAEVEAEPMQATIVFKYAAQILDEKGRKDPESLALAAKKAATRAFKKGFSKMLREHSEAWAAFWRLAEIDLEGDAKAQSAIRLGLFQLAQKQSKSAFSLPFLTFLTARSPAEAAVMLSAQARRATDFFEKSRVAASLALFFRWSGREVFSNEKALAFWLDLARGWAARPDFFEKLEARETGKKTLALAAEHLLRLKKADPETFKAFLIAQKFEEKKETAAWRALVEKMQPEPPFWSISSASLADYWTELAFAELSEWDEKTVEPLHEQAIRGSFELLFDEILGIAPDGERLALAPKMPEKWASVGVKIWFRGNLVRLLFSRNALEAEILDGPGCWISVFGKLKKLALGQIVEMRSA